eukprot:4731723-Lingulodinium_polyedra.AAC.1
MPYPCQQPARGEDLGRTSATQAHWAHTRCNLLARARQSSATEHTASRRQPPRRAAPGTPAQRGTGSPWPGRASPAGTSRQSGKQRATQ